jgi:hypothetical protein
VNAGHRSSRMRSYDDAGSHLIVSSSRGCVDVSSQTAGRRILVGHRGSRSSERSTFIGWDADIDIGAASGVFNR